MAKGNTTSNRSAATETVVSQPSSVLADLPEGFKVKRSVTLPVIVIKKAGDFRVLKITDAMRISKIEDKKAAKTADGEKKREPATICTVIDVKSGEMGTFIVNAVVKSNLERDYPNDSYVDKTFYIKNRGKRQESQRYNDFDIHEVEAQ